MLIPHRMMQMYAKCGRRYVIWNELRMYAKNVKVDIID